MNYKSKAAFIITACLLVAVYSDQEIDCRKMVFSRYCRGVANKRDDISKLKQQASLDDNLSLKRLLHDISSGREDVPEEVLPPRNKPEGRSENELPKEKAEMDRLHFRAPTRFRKRNNDNDYYPWSEY